MPTATLSHAANLFDFFEAEVTEACRSAGIGLTRDAGLYVAQLLTERARTEADTEPEPTLAELHARAAGARPAEQARTYRALGDRALHTLGCFRGHVAGRSVSPAYYAEMGAAAYDRVDRVTKTWFAGAFGDLFEELSDRFEACVVLVDRIRRRQVADDLDDLWAAWTAPPGDEAVEARRTEAADALRRRGLVLPRGGGGPPTG
jgi:hypothetical protein